MLMVDVSSSVEEAQSSARTLNVLVQQILKSNQELSSRLANLETHLLSSTSASVAYASQSAQEIDSDSLTIRYENRVPNLPGETGVENTDNGQDLIEGFGFAFDRDLKSSRAYMRILSRDSNMSSSSSVAPTIGWSFLSGLSLADVSNISMLSLPISPNELWNPQYYGFDMSGCEDSSFSNVSPPLSSTATWNAGVYPRDESAGPSISPDSPLLRTLPQLPGTGSRFSKPRIELLWEIKEYMSWKSRRLWRHSKSLGYTVETFAVARLYLCILQYWKQQAPRLQRGTS